MKKPKLAILLNKLFMMHTPLQRFANKADNFYKTLPGERHDHVTGYLNIKLQLVWMLLNDCTCGSGGHPRKCKAHPWGWFHHTSDMNMDIAFDRIQEMEERLKALDGKEAS